MSRQNQSKEREQVRFWTHGTPAHLEAVCKTVRGLRYDGVFASTVSYRRTWKVLTKPKAEIRKLQELAYQNGDLVSPPKYEAEASIESIGIPDGTTVAAYWLNGIDG
jgi:hypothetical protein